MGTLRAAGVRRFIGTTRVKVWVSCGFRSSMQGKGSATYKQAQGR